MVEDRHIHALPNGYRLHWYEIDAVLGQGSFGITYLAHDVNLNQRCAIKEFLPTDLAVRTDTSAIEPVSGKQADSYSWGLSRFIKEAQTLARFKHPNIVAVNAVFQENNTAYLVMEYVDGEVLEDVLRRRRLRSEADLLDVLLPIMDGVEVIHEAGIIHRDIKPDNIYLRRDGTPVLLDFGSARAAVGVRGEVLTALVSPGYAPYEQYDSSEETDKQGPWTDIYALGATFYRAVTGREPTDAMSRVHDILEGNEKFEYAADVARGWYSEQFLSGIDAALAFRPGDRPQSVAAWRELLPPRPGTETAPEDDSGLDLLLVPSEEGDDDWASQTNMDLLLEVDEETVNLNLKANPTDSSDAEEETVVLDESLLKPGAGAVDSEEQATGTGPVAEAEKPQVLGPDDETAILQSPVNTSDAGLQRSPSAPVDPDEETVIMQAPVDTSGSSLVDGSNESLGSDEETVISPTPLGGPVTDAGTDVKAPLGPDDDTVIAHVSDIGSDESTHIGPAVSIGPEDETVVFDSPPGGGDDDLATVVNLSSPSVPDPQEEPTVIGDAARLADDRVPFETIISEVAELGKDRTEEPSVEPLGGKPARKPLNPLWIKIAGGLAVALVIALLWMFLHSPAQRAGTGRQLTAEQIAEREAKRQLAQEQRDEQASEAAGLAQEQAEQAAEAERLANEQAERLAQEQAAEAERLAKEQAERLAQEQAAEAERLANEQAERLAQEQAAEAERLANEQAERLAQEQAAEAERLANEQAERLAQEQAAEAERLANEQAERLAQEQAAEAERLAKEQAERLAQEQAAEAERLAKEQAERLAQEQAAEAERLAKEQAERLAQEQAAEAERLAKEQAQKETPAQIDTLLSAFQADLDALRLTSPPGNNALEKLQKISQLAPDHPQVGPGYEAIVERYVTLADNAIGVGDYDKAASYLDRAEGVFADSETLADARDRLTSIGQTQSVETVDSVVQPVEEVQEETTPVEVVAALDPCAPKVLATRRNAFPGVLSTAYDHPAFRDAPAPQIRWARYRYSAVVNKKATEQSISRYDIVDADGVAARVQKRHELNFDNGAGTASFNETSRGQHVQVLGGLISPIDEIRSSRETTITKDGVTQTTNTDNNTRIDITRLYEVAGQLFPMKVGNSFAYKGDSRVVANGKETRIVKHEGKPHKYRVSGKVPGAQISKKLTCDVFVVDYVFEKPNYRNAGKLYFSPEIGLIAKQVGDAVSTLDNGRKIERHYERTLLDFEKL